MCEEKFELVINNFLELEDNVHRGILENMVLRGRRIEWFNEQRNTLNRRLYNLLSGCRSYIDYVKQYSNAILGNFDFLSEAFSSHYDNHFSYRLMEALRNFVTHGGFLTTNPARQSVSSSR